MSDRTTAIPIVEHPRSPEPTDYFKRVEALSESIRFAGGFPERFSLAVLLANAEAFYRFLKGEE